MLKGLNELSKKVSEQADERGLYSDVDVIISSADDMPECVKTMVVQYGLVEKIGHLHSEVTECYKALMEYDQEGFETELADVILMTLSIIGTLDVDIESKLAEKFKINGERESKFLGTEKPMSEKSAEMRFNKLAKALFQDLEENEENEEEEYNKPF